MRPQVLRMNIWILLAFAASLVMAALPASAANTAVKTTEAASKTTPTAKDASGQTKAIVYKTPTCGCCTAWEKHLRDNGFAVESRMQDDLGPIKSTHFVTPQLASCHTALIDGYVVEGHVPAEAIRRMLKERPKIKGIAAPGMPRGSPGMEGPIKDKYDVVTFDEKGKTSVYMSF